MVAKDEALSSDAVDSTGVEMGMFEMYSFDPALDELAYSEVGQGEESASDIVIRTKATGNIGLDEEYSAYNSVGFMCPDYPTCAGNTIAVAQEKYDLTGSKAWASMDYILTTSAAEKELNCPKTADTTPGDHNVVQGTKDSFWKISIPGGQAAATYTGSNTITAVWGENTDW